MHSVTVEPTMLPLSSTWVGPDAVLLSANRFAFPAGGAPTLNYPAPFIQPIGSAVSPDKGSGD